MSGEFERADFAVGHSIFRIASPKGSGPEAQAARARLDESGEGLVELTFRVDDIDSVRRRLKKLSLEPDEISEITDAGDTGNLGRLPRRTNLPARFSQGLPISFSDLPPFPEPQAEAATISAIDLVVVATSNPERAAFFYGARLGLALILDRINPHDGNRLMQFACGDELIEVIHRPKQDVDETDRIWGIGWRVEHAESVQERLKGAGRNVSDVKDGAKPGTRVFTIRDGTCNVPTLVVQHVHK